MRYWQNNEVLHYLIELPRTGERSSSFMQSYLLIIQFIQTSATSSFVVRAERFCRIQSPFFHARRTSPRRSACCTGNVMPSASNSSWRRWLADGTLGSNIQPASDHISRSYAACITPWCVTYLTIRLHAEVLGVAPRWHHLSVKSIYLIYASI